MRLARSLGVDLRTHPWDYAVVAAMAAIAMLALVTRIDVEAVDAYRFRPDTWWAGPATIALCATLVGRRRWPLRALALGAILVAPLELAHQRDSVAFFVLAVALYSAAARLPLRLAGRGVGLMAALYGGLLTAGTALLSSAPALGPGILAAAFALGVAIQRSRARQQLDTDAAIRRAAATIETAELHAADERLRMAQELHDVVAHSLGVIAVQAGIGAHLVGRQPIEAARALDAIRTTCETTDCELTRLVTILRDGDAPAATSAPTIAQMEAVVEHIRAAGVPVDVTIDGDPTAVPDGVSLAAYRIVQEALTNVVRHAGPAARASVTVRVATDHIDLLIDDDGRGTTSQDTGSNHGGGNGLVGMGERARMYGGDVRTGPRPGGGFRVDASLRLRADSLTIDRSAPPPAVSTRTPAATPDRRRFPAIAADPALAVVMALIAMMDVLAADPTGPGPHATPAGLWAISLRLGISATLAFRRRHPTIAYVAGWVLTLALGGGDYQVGVMVFVLWIGLYTIAAYSSSRHLLAAGAGTGLGLALLVWSRPPDLTTGGAAWASVFFAASAIAGYVVGRDRERRTRAVTEQQLASADHSRHARLILTNERLRIADELSTVVTRSIHTIAQQADTGTRSAGADNAGTLDALQTISTISREALDDLRRLLKQLRTSSEPVNYNPIIPTPDAAVSATR